MDRRPIQEQRPHPKAVMSATTMSRSMEERHSVINGRSKEDAPVVPWSGARPDESGHRERQRPKKNPAEWRGWRSDPWSYNIGRRNVPSASHNCSCAPNTVLRFIADPFHADPGARTRGLQLHAQLGRRDPARRRPTTTPCEAIVTSPPPTRQAPRPHHRHSAHAAAAISPANPTGMVKNKNQPHISNR